MPRLPRSGLSATRRETKNRRATSSNACSTMTSCRPGATRRVDTIKKRDVIELLDAVADRAPIKRGGSMRISGASSSGAPAGTSSQQTLWWGWSVLARKAREIACLKTPSY